MIALSVLDQSPIPSGSTAADAVAETLALAREADRLGYRRYWLAEHHNTASLAGTAPEILIPVVAAQTTSIRVGSGAVLLSHYSPLKVAETFRMLEVLFPGRVDLGLGRADGADAAATAELQRGWAPSADDDYPGRLSALLGFLRPGPEAPAASDAGYEAGSEAVPDQALRVRAMPDSPSHPEVWVLGSSSHSAALAARLGLPFSFAHFISPEFGPQVMAGYRRQFQPSSWCPEPKASVAVSVVCADTDEDAERLARSQDLWHLLPEGAARGALLSWQEAQLYEPTDLGRDLMAQQRRRRVTGAPDRVKSVLDELAGAYRVDELVVKTVVFDPVDRRRSYQLLASAFGLAAANPGDPVRVSPT